VPTLYLLRHARYTAKAGIDDPPLDDVGRADAARLGAHMETAGLVPDTILYSTARRAAETCEIIAGRLGTRPDIISEWLLTATDEEGLLALLRLLDDTAPRVMLIGHNPTMHRFALWMTGAGAAPTRSRLERGFAPGAFAAIELPDRPWQSQGSGDGELRAFLTPADY
jgi:phosphohistidine phosphatase